MARGRGRAGWLVPPACVSERNVKLSLSLSVLASLVSTIAHGHLFTAFIFELFQNNAAVGLTESVTGFTALVFAVPVGFAVDKISRTKLLRFCAVLGLLAAVTGALAVVLGPRTVHTADDGSRQPPGRAFTLLLVASLAFWGVFFNTTASAAQALFADSVPRSSRQDRQDLYATKATLRCAAFAAGPLVAFVCTVLTGNDWKLEHMSYALLPGFLLMPVVCVLLNFFEEVDAKLADLEVGLLAGSTPKADPDALTLERLKAPGARWVPFLLLAAEVITAIGAGMTVKFFGLWFKNVYAFSPAGLAALSSATPIAMAIATDLLKRVARACPVGPVPAVLGFWLASIVCLLAMVKVQDWRVLVGLHLVRTALANAKEPIATAILADFVPSSKRGRWNALHSLTGMTFTGSAALGGLLCDRYGYGKTFFITAGLYLVAAAFWVPLIRLVPRDYVKAAGRKDDVADKAKGA